MFQFWVDFIQKLVRKDDSAQVAAGRLKGSVFLDRLSLSPATLERIRNDVVRSISRYLVIDESAMTLAVQAEGRVVALAAQIPVVRPREGAASDGFAVHETHEITRAEPPSAVERTVNEASVPSLTPNQAASLLDPRARARSIRRRRQGGRRLGI